MSHFNRFARTTLLRTVLFSLVAALVVFGVLYGAASRAEAAGSLTVEILAGENLVVDSNVKSPSTAGPSVATVAAKVCNPDSNAHAVNNVLAQISYPTRSVTINGAGPFTYQLYHLGGASDANRFIGTLDPGECSVQYWSFEYPRCTGATQATQTTTPCAGEAVWGLPTVPGDDLWLQFDVNASGIDAMDNVTPRSASDSHDMTMRNEISAMANKIKPNPDGEWFNTDTNVVNPGDILVTNGINYTFGNVNKGFDNDGDGFYDFNAWVQPFGDTGYNPACFRLLKTEGTLTVARSGGNPPMVLNFVDQLYFTNLPDDNTNVTGRVYYTFMALDGACVSGLTPYQEAASGADNEKFNADYGTGVPPLKSTEPLVTIDKTSSPELIYQSTDLITYYIPFQNTGTKDAGLFITSGGLNIISPLVIEDTVPSGLSYDCGTASANVGVSIRYSNDSGATWSTNESSICGSGDPASTGNIKIQWWLNDKLAPGASGQAQFTVYATTPASAPVYVENTACASFGEGPKFDCPEDGILLRGNNNIGDFVWRDNNRNGLQDDGASSGIANLTVSLYYDANNNGTLEDADVLIDTQETNASGGYDFLNLPDARYIVKVDRADAPAGYDIPSDTLAVNLINAGDIDYNDADFGFQPILSFDKQIIGSAYGGGQVIYTISLTNHRAGDGNPPGPCIYYRWGTTATTGARGASWTNATNAQGAPNSTFAIAPFKGNAEDLSLAGFRNADAHSGSITKVEVIFPAVVVPTLAGSLDVNINDTAGSTTAYAVDASGLANGTLAYEVWNSSGLNLGGHAFSWNDFDSALAAPAEGNTSIELVARKTGNPSGDLWVDALGYRITTNTTCGDPANTMTLVPLTDTFVTSKFDFRSSIPPATSVDEASGLISWENVGPIYGGQTKVIYVTLTANQPPDTNADGEPDPINDAENENCAATTGGRIADGRLINDASDCVDHPINPGGIIGDKIWYDADNDGVDDGAANGEFGIPNVSVELYDCGAGNCNDGDEVLVQTTSTNGSGIYTFYGVPDINRSYTVRVNTDTLPNAGTTTWTNTYDDDVTGGGNTNNDGRSGPISIDFDNNNSTLDTYYGADFAYRTTSPMILGNIWHDRNNSGTSTPDASAGEENLAGVVVYLQSGSCNPPPSGGNQCPYTHTDAFGNYYFTNVTDNRTYTVGVYTGNFNQPTAYPTNPLSSGTWTGTYDTDGSTIGVVSITIPNNSDRAYRADYSYRQTGTATIGNLVWKDWNGDGVFNNNESGIDGVPVRLYLDVNGNGVYDAGDIQWGATQTTAGGGLYSFTNVPTGDYIVVVDASDPDLDNTVQTGDPDQPGTTCTTCDSRDLVPNVTAGTSYKDEDFGYRPTGTASIGDLVWRDDDGDGIQDAGEPGLQNISVSLYVDLDADGIIDSNEPLVSTTLTDSSGAYSFNNLPAGTYLVDVNQYDSDLPSSGGFRYVLSTDDSPASAPPSASDPSIVNGPDNDAHQVVLSAGEQYKDADFGFTPGGLIGDFVWNDVNGNGSQDTGETGIQNVTVLLYVDTNNNGSYDAGTDQRYYYDANGNGALDGGETNVSATTDASGRYTFTNLPPQTYFVVIDGAQAALSNYTLTGDPNSPTTPCSGSDCNGWTKVVLYGGQEDRSADFGYQQKGTIGDFVWQDLDADGVQDPYEAGIPGVVVELRNGVCTPGSTCPTTTTDANGFYSFAGLPDGASYTVAVISGVTGYTNTYDPDAGIAGGSANPNGSTPFTISGGNVTWSGADQSCSSACNPRLDFGYRLTSGNSISGTFFFDANGGNGGPYIPGTDIPLGGVTVYLFKDGLVYASTTTDANGNYSFTNLPDDTTGAGYTVLYYPTDPTLTSLNKDSEPDNLNCDGGGTPCDNRRDVGPLSSGTAVPNMNFGFFAASMDCGDLPDTYNTLPTAYKTSLASSGPCHVNNSGGGMPAIYLGNNWDSESDGRPNSTAQGDDQNGVPDDEDGITVMNPDTWTPGGSGTIRISKVTGDNAYLAGWFDWNKDGDFVNSSTGQYDTGEYVYFDHIPNGSTNLDLQVSIPAGAGLPGMINMRFRLYEGNSPPPLIAPGGIVLNGEDEDYQEPLGPTAVTMGDFAAISNQGQIVLNWNTILELDAIGFNLYRSTSQDGERVQLNAELIPSQALGGLMGAEYQFVDPNVQYGVTYYYWLEFIDTYGSTYFGPHPVMLLNKVYLPTIIR